MSQDLPLRHDWKYMRIATERVLTRDVGIHEKLTIMGYGCGPAADPRM